jgi:UDP-GlcNAc:undecaprenyl-phosphate GlcNAc-1-phosphate transferase
MSEGWRIVGLPLASCVLTVCLIPPIRWLATRWGCVALPSTERWHQRPTPYLGGIAFFIGWLLPTWAFSPAPQVALPFFLVAFQMFLLGLFDDLRRINPVIKLAGQIIAAATAISCGYSIQFFAWSPLNILLTAFWIVGLTNALNLLDNMDGLAGGIGLIAALYLAVLFYREADIPHLLLACALVGAVAGFLFFNFHPASIFMGDAGSLFLGSSLGLFAIQARGQASNILSLVAVPALILLVPILDTALVTLTRLLRGQPISQGGKDHSSHRLVVLGLSEPRAVVLLYGMAVLSGATAILIEHLSYMLSLALVPLIVLAFALFTAYLAEVEVLPVEAGEEKIRARGLPAVLISLTYRRRLLEVLLDFVLIAVAYYLAFALRFNFAVNGSTMELYLSRF